MITITMPEWLAYGTAVALIIAEGVQLYYRVRTWRAVQRMAKQYDGEPPPY